MFGLCRERRKRKFNLPRWLSFPPQLAPAMLDYQPRNRRRASARAVRRVCPERHNPNSIATLGTLIARCLLRQLGYGPFCGSPSGWSSASARHAPRCARAQEVPFARRLSQPCLKKSLHRRTAPHFRSGLRLGPMESPHPPSGQSSIFVRGFVLQQINTSLRADFRTPAIRGTRSGALRGSSLGPGRSANDRRA